jgi:hypothetical protein
LEKTTIRLSKKDVELLDLLGEVLGHKLGKLEKMNHSEVIRYSIRTVADKELISRQQPMGHPATSNGNSQEKH